MPTETIRKSFEIEAKAAKVDENFIEGHPSVMGNMDRGGDVIFPGFFRKVLRRFKQHGFITQSHDWSTYMAMPIAAEERGNVLYSKAEWHSTPDAQALRQKCAERQARGLSIGLSVGFSLNYETGRQWFESGKDMWAFIEAGDFDKKLFDKASILSHKGRCRALLPDGCEDLFEWAIAPAPMNMAALATTVKSGAPDLKSKSTTVGEILQAKIHQSFTVAADEIAIRGYMSTDERIALSKNIGDALTLFRSSLDPTVAARDIDAGDVDWIASKSISLDDEALNAQTFEDHSNSVLTAVRGLSRRFEDYKSTRQDKGRSLSDARRQEIEELKGLLDDLLTSTVGTPRREVLDQQRKSLALRRSLATLNQG